MHALLALTRANIKSYTRDRAAVFWTLAFPLVFIVLFGLIFQGGSSNLTLGWVDDDGSTESAQLRADFAAQPGVTLVDATQSDAISQMEVGKVDSVIVVPAGYGATVAANSEGTPGTPAQVAVYTDPSRPNVTAEVFQVVGSVFGVVNLAGRHRTRPRGGPGPGARFVRGSPPAVGN